MLVKKIVLALSVALIANGAALLSPPANALPPMTENSSQAQRSPAGLWAGSVSLPNGKSLQVAVSLQQAHAEWRGNISIPQQGAKELPLKDIVFAEGQITFSIDGVKGSPTFKGKIDAETQTMSGEFTQGPASMPFALKRQAAAPGANADASNTETSSTETAPARLSGFDQEVEKIRAEWKVPGVAIAIVKGEQTVYAKGHGFRDVQKKLPMTADTLLPIGSASKAFTTALMARLVEEGKLSWEQPVRQWLPAFKLQDPLASERITPLDLVTHRSGLPRHDALWYNATLSRAEMVQRLQYLEPSKDFRSEFQYNNLMYVLAGHLTEVVSGQSWEDSLREKLLLPLGMTRSNFSVEQTRKDADFSQPYREDKNGNIKQIPFRSLSHVGPAGSINASVNELSAWLKLHLNQGQVQGKPILSAASINSLHTPRISTGSAQPQAELLELGYAPGWFTDVYRGHLRLHHGGKTDGFSALILLLPHDGIGVAVLGNLEGSPVREFIARRAVDRLLDLPARDWSAEALQKKSAAKDKAGAESIPAQKAGTKPSHALSDYVGEYEHPGYGVVSVSQQKNQLQFEFNGIRTPLAHWHYDTFNGQSAEDPVFENQKLQFLTNQAGDIEALQSAFEPAVKDIRFSKKVDRRFTDPAFLQKLTGSFAFDQDREFSISLRGNTLVAEMKGRPSYELVPVRGYRFDLKGMKGFSIEFKPGADGRFDQAEIARPNGVSQARRK